MAKRTICIQSPSKITVKQSQLLVSSSSADFSIPLDDVWVVILETHQAQVSTSALSEIVNAGIGVMICGDNHMPNGLLLPLGAHSRHAAIVEDQLSISKPLAKRLWRRIVIAKIKNQAAVLEQLDIPYVDVKSRASRVLSGDTTNQESAAASAYFKLLITEGSRRDGPYEAPLDYGYAVLRAGIAREAVSGGWLVSRGIHHHNNLNAFNLVDDLIEPFRPVVDLLVISSGIKAPLEPQDKALLVRVFEVKVYMSQKSVSIQHAIHLVLCGLRDAVLASDDSLLVLPEIHPLEFASYE